jgi:membrane protein implicated in regulation of membrane protease activity
MSGFSWWTWIIVAGGLGLAEMFVPGAYLAWIALGAALTGGADAAFGLSLEAQLAVFAATTALSCAGGHFVYRELSRRQGQEEPLNERHRAMLGQRGTVCEAFVSGRGKVRIGDSVWLAAGPDLDEGTTVVVSGFRGTRLIVEAMRSPARSQSSAGS